LNEADRLVNAWILYWYKYSGLCELKAKLHAIVEQCRVHHSAGRVERAATLARGAISGLPVMHARCQSLHTRYDELQRLSPDPSVLPSPLRNETLKMLDSFRPNEFASS